jgi:hypothetical protein
MRMRKEATTRFDSPSLHTLLQPAAPHSLPCQKLDYSGRFDDGGFPGFRGCDSLGVGLGPSTTDQMSYDANAAAT